MQTSLYMSTKASSMGRSAIKPMIRRVAITVRHATGNKKSVRDEWQNPTFAREWSLGGGAERTNPDRARQLSILGAVCRRVALSPQTANPTILEVGCGSGLSGAAICSALPPSARCVGVDGSEAMLALAREIAPTMETRHLDFETATEQQIDETLRALGSPFAAVTYVQMLHELNVEGKRSALALARRHLQPGAPVVVLDRFTFDAQSVFTSDYSGLWDALSAGQSDMMSWDTYHAKYIGKKLDDAVSEAEQVKLLREAGFAHVEVLYRAFNRSLIVARD